MKKRKMNELVLAIILMLVQPLVYAFAEETSEIPDSEVWEEAVELDLELEEEEFDMVIEDELDLTMDALEEYGTETGIEEEGAIMEVSPTETIEEAAAELMKAYTETNITALRQFPGKDVITIKNIGEDLTLRVEADAADPEKVWFSWRDPFGENVQEGNEGTLYVTEPKSGTYMCTVKDGCGSAKLITFRVIVVNHLSAEPVLLEGDGILRLEENGDINIYAAENASLVIGVQADGDDLEGLTYSSKNDSWDEETNTFRIENVKETKQYLVTVQDQYGNIKTVKFMVVVHKLDVISAPRRYYDVEVGDSLTIGVDVKGDGCSEITYEWTCYSRDKVDSVTVDNNQITLSGIRSNIQLSCLVRDQFGNVCWYTPTVRVKGNTSFTVNVNGEYMGEQDENKSFYTVYIQDDGSAFIEITPQSSSDNTFTYKWSNAGLFTTQNFDLTKGWSENYLHVENAKDGLEFLCMVTDAYAHTKQLRIQLSSCKEHIWGTKEVVQFLSGGNGLLADRYTCERCGAMRYSDTRSLIEEPEITSAVCEEEGIRLTWNASTYTQEAVKNNLSIYEGPIYTYSIYRRKKGENGWEDYRIDAVSDTTAKEFSYLDSQIEEGIEYEYAIRAHSVTGQVSMLGTKYQTVVYHFDPIANLFTDVNDGNWYYEAVQDVFRRGLMTGMNETYFGAEESLSRAQFAAILYRRAGYPIYEYQQLFPDVPEGEWFTQCVLWTWYSQVILGYNDGCFGPADELYREQLCTILWRYAKEVDGFDNNARAGLDHYPDHAQVSDFAVEAVQWCEAMGILNDRSGRIGAWEAATRADCATMISRYMQAIGK